MTAIPTTLKSTAAGFEPAYSHVSTKGDRHADLFCAIAIVARTTLPDVFKAAEALGLPKTGPYYHFLTEELLSGIGASFGLVFTVWKEVTKIANLPDLSIVIIRYSEDYEVGESCVFHRAKASHDGKMVTYAILPSATAATEQVRTELDSLAPAWYIGVHSMKTATTKK
ncbi:hypothetical protein CR105_11775 [Massilia eurypsychrophila]|uniref:Uncharacterized protein n=1 Tax=Massilia eurypsychrophila TaxID=1485217 RepID=A0A2G8TG30_9BURK|nr:hypothetical protein [Massilia eurypsychrophila]PIL44598.1 hypothetical protein CR105_11775 [Massilia eurypsychrophila]